MGLPQRLAFPITLLCPRTANAVGRRAEGPEPGARCYLLWYIISRSIHSFGYGKEREESPTGLVKQYDSARLRTGGNATQHSIVAPHIE